MDIRTRVEGNVTPEEADYVVNMIKAKLYHVLKDYEHDRFFKVVTDILIIKEDNSYLYGTTFVVGCYISNYDLERAIENIVHFDYDKMFPEKKRKKEVLL